MKLSLKLLALAVASFIVASLVGCKSAEPGSYGGLLSSNQSVKTNLVYVPVVSQQQTVATDPITGTLSTNVITVTNIVTRQINVTNVTWQPSATAQDVLQTANTIAPVTGPAAPFIPFGVGLAGVALAALARYKNNQLNETNDSLNDQLKAVIVGVEKASQTLSDGNKIKTIIADAATKLDVLPELHASVQDITK